MNRNTFFSLVAGIVLLFSCAGNGGNPAPRDMTAALIPLAEGDTSVCGLACDGCNDTILLLLLNLDNDPDTFNILDATRQHHIFGRPQTGDRITLMTDGDSTVARMAINVDMLCESWCYLSVPTLRQHAGVTEQMRQQFLQNMPDSVRDSLFAPREQGFMLMNDGKVMPIGVRSYNKDEGFVVYAPAKHYRQWQLFNGSLVLTETKRDSLGNSIPTDNDTASIVLLRRDSLVLRLPDGDHSYYRKKSGN